MGASDIGADRDRDARVERGLLDEYLELLDEQIERHACVGAREGHRVGERTRLAPRGSGDREDERAEAACANEVSSPDRADLRAAGRSSDRFRSGRADAPPRASPQFGPVAQGTYGLCHAPKLGQDGNPSQQREPS
jgi:hypothetical protein